MCDECDWQGTLEKIEEANDLANQLREEEWAGIVMDTLEDMTVVIEENNHVTDQQIVRLKNIEGGIEERL